MNLCVRSITVSVCNLIAVVRIPQVRNSERVINVLVQDNSLVGNVFPLPRNLFAELQTLRKVRRPFFR